MMMHVGNIFFSACGRSGSMGHWLAILLLGFIFLLPTRLLAAESAEADAAAIDLKMEEAEVLFQPWVGAPDIPVYEQPQKPEPQLGIIEQLDEQRDYYSEKIVTFTKAVDEFFGDERYFQENNKSVIQLNLNQIIAQGGSRPFGFEGQVKLDLPAAQRRFQIVLESNPEKKASGDTKKELAATSPPPTTPDNYAASLRYEQKDETLWHFSSEAGANLQFPLDPFVRTRASYPLQFEEWRAKMAQSLFWFNTIGLGETTQLDLERVLNASLLFRATSTITCMESPQICNLGQSFSYYHTVDERTAVIYQASVAGANKPVFQETGYGLLMRYRYRLHKKWMFFEISPQLSFPRDDSFRLNALLLLRLEMLFGATD